MARRAGFPLALTALLTILVGTVSADVAPEEVGRSMVLPAEVSPHWLWVPDRLFRHSVLFDGDTGRMLASLDSGVQLTPKPPQWSKRRGEIYTVDTVYSRGHRGERQDYVVVYDAKTLRDVADIAIPPRSTDTSTGLSLFGLLDGDRFLVVLNQSPGASVTVVDLDARSVASEIQIQGCAGVFPVDARRFGTLCGNGTAITVQLTEDGALERLASSTRFFDPVADPITEKGVRDGTVWRFASFEGFLHEVDFAGDTPVAAEPWSLFSDSERSDRWRIGGAQHLAFHGPTRRLYSIVHQGGPGSHKDPGPEIWVYDVDAKSKVATFEPSNLMAAFIAPQAGFDAEGTLGAILNFLLPNLGVHSIAVTPDEAPLLFYRHADLGAVGVLDARDGTHLRDIDEAGLSGALLVVP